MISLFLKKRLSEKGWTLNYLHELCGVRNSALAKIQKGETKSPDVDTLRKLARAFGDPLAVWLDAAGYLDDAEELAEVMKAKFGVLFKNPESARVLTRPGVAEFLNKLDSLPESKQNAILDAIKLITKGMDA